MLVGLILKALLCCSLNKTALTNLYDNNDIICDRLSSGFLYLFAWRATKYQRKDTRFQSFKLILAFQFVNQLFYCRVKRKWCPRGKYHVSSYYHAKS